jgi:hypothetical protein
VLVLVLVLDTVGEGPGPRRGQWGFGIFKTGSKERMLGMLGPSLGIGDESRVTHAIRRLKSGLEPEMQRLKEQLEKAFESGMPADT